MVVLPEEERIAWIWCIIIAFAVPEFGTLVRSIRMCIFKSWKKPQSAHFLLVFIMETFHVVGLALMFLAVLPELDVVKGAMLTNCVCFVPGLLGNTCSPAKPERFSPSVAEFAFDFRIPRHRTYIHEESNKHMIGKAHHSCMLQAYFPVTKAKASQSDSFSFWSTSPLWPLRRPASSCGRSWTALSDPYG